MDKICLDFMRASLKEGWVQSCLKMISLLEKKSEYFQPEFVKLLENNQTSEAYKWFCDHYPLISEDEYVEHHGLICPFCKSKNIGTLNDFNPESRSISVKCEDCGKTWHDTYALVGYDYE